MCEDCKKGENNNTTTTALEGERIMAENTLISKITETDQYKKIEERTEKKEMKKAAKLIVGKRWASSINQIESSIEEQDVELQMSKLQHNAALAEKQDKVDKKMCEIDLRKVLQKSSLFFYAFSIVASIVSVFMSCAGLSNACSPGGLLEALSGRYWIAVLLMCLMQSSVIIYSFFSYALDLYHSDKNFLLNAFRFVVMAVSIYCNYLFIQSIIPEYGDSKIGKLISIILASGADIISNLFSSTAVKMKYKLYSQNGLLANGELDNRSLLAKLKIIIFGNLMFKIEKTYREKMAMYSELAKGKGKLTTHSQRCYPKSKKSVVNENGDLTISNEDIGEYEHRKPAAYDVAIQKMMEIGIEPGDKIRRGMIGLDRPDWKAVRRYMQLNGIVKCVKKTTFLEKDLKELENAM